MTRMQNSFVVAFLRDLSERYKNDDDSDILELPNTIENRELVRAAQTHMDESDEEITLINTDTIMTGNSDLVDYLADKLMKELGIPEQELPKVG